MTSDLYDHGNMVQVLLSPHKSWEQIIMHQEYMLWLDELLIPELEIIRLSEEVF